MKHLLLTSEGSSPSLPWPTSCKLSQLDCLHFNVEPEIMRCIRQTSLRNMRLKRRSVFPVPSLPHTTISRVPSYFGDDNEFTHIHRSPLSHLRKVNIQLELRSLFAMPLSVSSRYSILTRTRHYLIRGTSTLAQRRRY